MRSLTLLLVLAAAAPGAAGITSRTTIRKYMARTHEVGSGGRPFTPSGPRHTIPDGTAGGRITAQVGILDPSGDGTGYALFFFHNQRFLGWDSVYDSIAVGRLRVSRSRFVLTYGVYKSDDPSCCPSRKVTVRYSWTGARIKQSRPIPKGARGGRIVLR
jgi:LppP/LprE lipoprotein